MARKIIIIAGFIILFQQPSLAGNLDSSSVNAEVSLGTGGNTRDVVYLKNGSIIRGNVVEMIPDSTLRIQTADSSVYVFPMTEVEKM